MDWRTGHLSLPRSATTLRIAGSRPSPHQVHYQTSGLSTYKVGLLLAMRSIVQRNPGEGVRALDRPYPLTPTLSHRSRIYLTSTSEMPNSGKPELGGEGAD